MITTDRTPLNTVCVGLELLEVELVANEAVDSCVKTVIELRDACVTAVEILNDLLQYEKLESGIMKLEVTEQAVLPLLIKVLNPFVMYAQQKGVEFKYLHRQLLLGETDLSGLVMHVDHSKMSQVLRNLVSNALKFTPALPGNSVEVSADLVSRDGSLFLRINCVDTGSGIASENQHRIFNEIVQFDANAQQGGGGSGLGLWITKQIVELYGGRVGLYSEGKNRGSTFWIG
jgi:signal transduction histidine kinase